MNCQGDFGLGPRPFDLRPKTFDLMPKTFGLGPTTSLHRSIKNYFPHDTWIPEGLVRFVKCPWVHQKNPGFTFLRDNCNIQNGMEG